MKIVIRSLVATVLLAVLTGLLFPLAITFAGQALMADRARGSLLVKDGRVVGSSLIGQYWEGAEWFHGRPSATATPYDASASASSNLGPRSRVLAVQIKRRASDILRLEGPYRPGIDAASIPVDLLTASASGLDPNISPEAARFQAPRVSSVRNLPLGVVQDLIARQTSGPGLGILGRPRVNVLQLNLALEELERK